MHSATGAIKNSLQNGKVEENIWICASEQILYIFKFH